MEHLEWLHSGRGCCWWLMAAEISVYGVGEGRERASWVAGFFPANSWTFQRLMFELSKFMKTIERACKHSQSHVNDIFYLPWL